jgi:hypothetical protein
LRGNLFGHCALLRAISVWDVKTSATPGVPVPSASQRSQLARIASHESWTQTSNRTARTANARNAFEARFLAEADGDPLRAESLRKAYFARLAYKSVEARRNRRDAAGNAARVAAELRECLAALESGNGADDGPVCA